LINLKIVSTIFGIGGANVPLATRLSLWITTKFNDSYQVLW